MSHLQKIQQNGYSLMVDNRAIGNMRSTHGYGVAGIKHTYNAPKGFVPGKNEDSSKGYSTGSEIITQDERVFKCVNGQEGKWVLLHAGKSSYTENNNMEIADTPQPAEEKEPDLINPADFGVVKDTEQEKPDSEVLKNQKGEVIGGNEEAPSESPKEDVAPTPLPEDIPFYGYLTDKNDIHTLKELKKVASKKKGLESLKFFNKDRAKKVADWLERNG